jgi:DNA-binding NtrC family response regulator
MKQDLTSIFIVEDDKFYATLVKDFLAKKNYSNVEVFGSGEACLENMHRSPSVVILDHGLGRTSGLDVLKKIKSINPNIHVIFLSAQEKMGVAINALKYGAYDYLEKNGGNLERLIHLLQRIATYDTMAVENLEYRRFKKWFFVLLAAAIVAVVCLGLQYPEWFE